MSASLKTNILANFVGKIWSLFSVFIFVPLYIKILGIEQYGLISFFATMQSVIFLLEVGLSATLRRELSTADISSEGVKYKYKLFRSSEILFSFFALVIILSVILLSSFIANRWLQVQNINVQVAETAIKLMGISIAAQLLSSLYFGGLLGLEKHQEANYYQILWSILKNGFVILIFYFVEADIRYFFSWFIISDIVYLILLRRSLTKGFVVATPWVFQDFKILKTNWKYTSGIILLSVFSVLNMQVDKLLVSYRFSLSDLGIYNLSFSLSQVPVIIINAFCIAIFSRFVYFYSNNDANKIILLFKLSYKVLLIIASTVSFTMAFFSKDLIYLWTGNLDISEQATGLFEILIVGSMFYTFQFIPFNFVLSMGVTKINVVFGFVYFVFMCFSITALIYFYGLKGAAFNWLLISLVSTPIYISLIYRRYIGNDWIRWLFIDSIFPISFVGILVVFCYVFISFFALTPIFNILFAGLGGLGIISLTIYLLVKNIFSSFKLIDIKSD